MRKHHLADRKSLHAPLHSLAALTLAAVLAASAAPAAADCSGSTALSLNDTYRSSGGELLDVTLSSAGVLTLDVSSPAAGVQPKIVFLGTSADCSGAAGEGSDFDYVWETPEWLAIRIYTTSSTTYHFQVAPQDSQQTLLDYKLRLAWVSNPTTPEEVDLSPDATNACSPSSTPMSSGDLDGDALLTITDQADEYDPDIMKGAIAVPGVMVVENEDTQGPDLEATLYSSTSCGGSDELDSAVLSGSSGQVASVVHPGDHALSLESYGASSGTYEVAVKLFAPCGLGETDDHGDDPLCATPVSVGGSQNGQIANATDDDEDWFTFVLAAQTTVEIETTGSMNTYGSLYDSAGQRLETDDDDGADYNFRIARILGPGRYYVRVEGASGAEGSYTLSVESQ